MVTPALTNDELAAIILPWAEGAHPEKAAQVRARAQEPATFRRWCGRLIELRVAADPVWAGQQSLRVLHETALRRAYRAPDDSVVVLCGRYADKPWQWTFAELWHLMQMDDPAAVFAAWQAWKVGLDLHHVTTR